MDKNEERNKGNKFVVTEKCKLAMKREAGEETGSRERPSLELFLTATTTIAITNRALQGLENRRRA